MFQSMESIIAVITSIITLAVTIYEICFKNEKSRSDTYYKELLVPFIIEYKKKSDIIPIEFLENKLVKK